MTAEALHRVAPRPLDVERVRKDFPVLEQEVRGKPLVYLDSAATSQKPRSVIDAIARYYLEDNANVHRGVHLLSERATQAYEAARERVQRFIHAAEAHEVVFVRGTTEAINLISQTYGRRRVGPGDEILLTEMEHHSNLVPWIILAKEKGAVLRHIPVTEEGTLNLRALGSLMSERTRLVSVMMVSNALGTVTPIKEIIRLAHELRIAPGIIVGQLQFQQRLGHGSGFNHLKRRFRWAGANLEMV